DVFIWVIEETSFFEGMEFNYLWTELMNLEKFGVTFMLYSSSLNLKGDINESLCYFINDNFEAFREEIIEIFISSEYPQVSYLLNLDSIKNLNDEDIRRISNSPNFCNKLCLAIKGGHPLRYIKRFLRYI
ncbi:hypothetical protein LCGC14_2425640, partial [marine sediment metagenome]